MVEYRGSDVLTLSNSCDEREPCELTATVTVLVQDRREFQ